MAEDVADLLLRYEYARDNLAAVDQHVQAAQLGSHIRSSLPLSDERQQKLAADLRDQAELSEKFGHAARALSSALGVAGEADAVARAT